YFDSQLPGDVEAFYRVTAVYEDNAESPPARASATRTVAQELIVEAVADTFVLDSEPQANFGSSFTLRADASPVALTYLRFEIGSIGDAEVASVALRLYARSDGAGIKVNSALTSDWTESEINYANAPGTGPLVVEAPPFSADDFMEVDVTALIDVEEQPVTLVIRNSDTVSAGFLSRESGYFAPQLVVRLAP
ncbi:MAG: DNRLRE domain-containing protein, partial [Dehalococcoidia bacterium]|nr:DNRLRE domain-containing protein [Dehalococcoidia bacterium]